MAREIEVKILGLDVEEFEKMIINNGAKFLKEEHQKNITINSTKNPIDKSLGYMRIRIFMNSDEPAEFTFKENLKTQGVRDNLERNVKIDDPKELMEILKLLGYDRFHVGEKLRKSYILEDLRFDIDIWDKRTYPHPYVEVEAPNEEILFKKLEELNIEKSSISTKSIAELIEELK